MRIVELYDTKTEKVVEKQEVSEDQFASKMRYYRLQAELLNETEKERYKVREQKNELYI